MTVANSVLEARGSCTLTDSSWDYLDTALDYRAAAVIAVGARLAQPAVQLITTTENDVAHPAQC